MLSTVAAWASVHAGSAYVILAINMYIWSKMSYVAQFFEPPDDIAKTVKKVCDILLPGPGNWVTVNFLCNLQELGASFEL